MDTLTGPQRCVPGGKDIEETDGQLPPHHGVRARHAQAGVRKKRRTRGSWKMRPSRSAL
jgi:hypothetical protein